VVELLVADGAMGTEILRAGLTAADYAGRDGCHDYLSVTRPDLIEQIHRRYLEAGCQAVETNSFGAHPLTLADYGLEAEASAVGRAAAAAARRAAAGSGQPGALVLGSMGPGSRLPSLGHATFQELRSGYAQLAEGLAEGGADRFLIETCQDLLQAKAAVLGARDAAPELPITVHFTVETSGTMLLGTEPPAAVAALVALGIDGIGLNCATGPAEMSEHLRQLAELVDIPVSVMPNAGLPVIDDSGEAHYSLGPEALADWLERYVHEYGLAMVGGCCGTTPEHLAAVVRRLKGVCVAEATYGVPYRAASGATQSGETLGKPGPSRQAGGISRPGAAGIVSSLYQAVPLTQETSYLVVGERTNANGSKLFRDALLAGDIDACMEVARSQAGAGAHVLDVSVDYVGRDGVADMADMTAALATGSTLPVMIDSTEPAVIRSALEHLGGRSLINSVNFEDPDRFEQIADLAVEHGAAVVALAIDEQGQARTAERKVAVARRLIEALAAKGLGAADVIVDPLTFPIGTGQAETRRDALETIEAIKQIRAEFPQAHIMLGISNVSFGLNPAARVVLNSVFLDQARQAGLDVAIVRPGGILPLDRLDPAAMAAAEDLVWDRREDGDPLLKLLDLTKDAADADLAKPRLDSLPVLERITQRLVAGSRHGIEADLDQAMAEGTAPLDIINNHLLTAMEQVGELFADGRMQLPFVLQSAEVMKAAIAHLEPALATGPQEPKGTVVLATVAGDVHDIGKNLVDIVLSNNGYKVINLGIKQSLSQMVAAAREARADAIGMSGLLVKSTQVMRQNLADLAEADLAGEWLIALGGAALTRHFVDDVLAPEFPGEVFYSKDAFECLRTLSALLPTHSKGATDDPARGSKGSQAAPSTERTGSSEPPEEIAPVPETAGTEGAASSELPMPLPEPPEISAAPETAATEMSVVTGGAASASANADVQIPEPPFWGARQAKGMPLAEYLPYLDKRALFEARWGLKAGRGEATVAELAAAEGEPALAELLDRVRRENLAEAQFTWGYFPARRDGDSIVVLEQPSLDSAERARLSFPRQAAGYRRCLADYLAADRVDVLALQAVTMGEAFSRAAADLFRGGDYRDYQQLHGLSVELTEALAEAVSVRIRRELNLPERRGRRYSLGYPACPDLGQRHILLDLLEAERIGLRLTEGDLLEPEQSTEAMFFHHPGATYFNAGRPT
jgi:5-methyltetrahydrofolate--homocysteine methyltransferase